ncbi:hypothetical protein J22TS3_22580 [Paenibacillus sp. J22TS3]|nr:hypothetical protein J22TS3_22580 [Paenibacillus sp. J22TS3]
MLKPSPLVLPVVQRRYYTDMKQGAAYFTYVSEELPAPVQDMFHVSCLRAA